MNPDEIRQKLQTVHTFVLDMDGTIFRGTHVFPFAIDFLGELSRKGINYIFLSNNSSRNVSDYAALLKNMQIPVSYKQIYTSAEATIEYLKKEGLGKRLYLVGTKNLHASFREAGFKTQSNRPDAVVVGFDTELTYEKLDRACFWIRKGIPFIATHPDLNCPVENGEMKPDCGAISAAITAATGVVPKVLGKPHREMLEGLLARTQTSPDRMILVGDRLTTDIKMGNDFGIFTVLVLTGEATREDLKTSIIQPDLIVEKISDLMAYLDPDSEIHFT